MRQIIQGDDGQLAVQHGGQPDRRRILVAVLVTVLMVCGWVLLQDRLTLVNLLRWEEDLRDTFERSPLSTVASATMVYVGVTSLSLPGATVLSLLFAWLFPFPVALGIVSFSSTVGATIAFLTVRWLASRWWQPDPTSRLGLVRAAFDRDGSTYLLSMRLVPAVPFFLVNIGMGFTSISTWTFIRLSWIGMLPGTVVYLLAGSQVPQLRELAQRPMHQLVTWNTLVALSLLGGLPWLLRGLRQVLIRPR